MQAHEGERQLLSSHVGIAQVDPFGRLTFLLVLANPLHLSALPACTRVAYLEKTVLTCASAAAMECLRAWEDTLATKGLSLKQPVLPVFCAFSRKAEYATRGFNVRPLDAADAAQWALESSPATSSHHQTMQLQ